MLVVVPVCSTDTFDSASTLDMQTNKLGYGFAPHRTALLLNRIFAKTIAGCCHHPCRTYRNWNDTRCSSSKRDITNNDRSEVIPPRSYTQQFGTPTRIVAQSIGVCRSPYMERAGAIPLVCLQRARSNETVSLFLSSRRRDSQKYYPPTTWQINESKEQDDATPMCTRKLLFSYACNFLRD